MTPPYELETTRLRLRQWQATDKAPFAKLNADKRVMEYFPCPLSTAQSNAMVDRLQGAIAQRGWGFWAVAMKQPDKQPDKQPPHNTFIGLVGLSIPRTRLPFSHCGKDRGKDCVEVGWRLDYPYWGKGYATEAAKASLAFGFETLALEEIVSFTALVNRRSQAVMERLGMQRDPHTFNHPSVEKGSPLEEHCLYRLTQQDWLNQK
ncbi:MAG: GNAT family N-acetyltransferase [Cyanobacteria bacterium P01_F01_bin.53]